MGIGTITLNLLYAKLLGVMIMAYKSLKELAAGSILGAGYGALSLLHMS
jgi:hypothetical protein